MGGIKPTKEVVTMTATKRRLYLEDLRPGMYYNTKSGDDFRIQKITNSTEFIVDRTISKDEVDILITRGWTVEIKSI